MADLHNLTAGLETPMQKIQPNSTLFSEPHFHMLTTVLTLVLPIITALYVHKDYRAFLRLGPGGTPSTPLGYLKIKLLSLICLRDPRRPLPIPPHFRPQTGCFNDSAALPKRNGTLPVIRGIAPQRQQTQKSDEQIYARLVQRIQSLATDPRNHLLERTSCFEKNSTGLFTSIPITRTCGGEICHAHPSDGSLHMSMHPADANMVIAKGWGERHPLARGGWCRRFVPREFCLVYAPRDEHELDVVLKIVAASVWWVSGVDVNGEEQGPRRKSADVAVVGEAMQGKGCWGCKAQACGGNKIEQLTGKA